MTPAQLSELERLCREATEGPWTTGKPNDPKNYAVGIWSPNQEWVIADVYKDVEELPGDANAAFIAAAREALPKLIAQVRDRDAAIRAAKEEGRREGLEDGAKVAYSKYVQEKCGAPAPEDEAMSSGYILAAKSIAEELRALASAPKKTDEGRG